MRFYHIEVGKIYSLDEFLEIQSTKRNNIELQIIKVCINVIIFNKYNYCIEI